MIWPTVRLLLVCLAVLGLPWFGNPPLFGQGVPLAQNDNPTAKTNFNINQRLNWNLLYKYINDMLPTPDGNRLAIKSRTHGLVRSVYFSKDTGQAALALLKKRRFDLLQERPPTTQDAKDDEKIKRDLVAINIEGITSLYADDLKPFADHLKDKKFDANLLMRRGMAEAEATKLMTEPDKLKESGWVVEIRGYTYHWAGEQFVIKTLVENLAYPENIYANLYPKKVDPKAEKKLHPLKTQVRDRLRYVFLYYSQTDTTPQPGEFRLIKHSYLQNMLTGGNEPPPVKKKGSGQGKSTPETDRDDWTVLGNIASAAMGVSMKRRLVEGGLKFVPRFRLQPPKEEKDKEIPQAGLVLTPRTEFVIYLVWLEPLGNSNWDHPVKRSDFANVPWFDGSGTASNKHEKPRLLAMDKQTQMDYVLGGTLAYKVDREEKTLTAFGQLQGKKGPPKEDGKEPTWDGEPVLQLRPTRMMVVSGTFPYMEQVAEYQKALRVPIVEDLFAKNLQPMFRGFNVLRAQVGPGGSLKDAEWMPIYTYQEKKDRVEAAKHIRDFLSDAVFDMDNVTQLGKCLTPNAATPLPALANATYPPLKLTDIQPLPLSKVKDKVGKKVEQIPEIVKVPFKQLAKHLLDKLTGQFNVVAQDGEFMDIPTKPDDKDKQPEENIKKPRVKPDPNKQKPEDEDLPNGYAFTKIPGKGKALIRFIDVDVQPGFTYQYKIQLVFANPNYKRENEVAHADVATPKILLNKDRFLTTATITIPDEYRFYIFDQASPHQDGKYDLKSVANNLTTRLRKPGSIDFKALPQDRVAIQIFQWVGKVEDRIDLAREYAIADWVAAERLFVGRGDKIGRWSVEVEVPVWNERKKAFEIGEGIVDPKKAPKFTPPGVPKAGVSIDFLLRSEPKDPQDLAPMVVDFNGGKGGGRQYRGELFDDKTNSPIEVLLLGADGKMTVLNSRDDGDDRATTEAGRRAAERAARYATWRARLHQVRLLTFPPPDKKEPGGKN